MEAWKSAPRGVLRCAAVVCIISLLVLNCAAELPDSPGATISHSQAAAESETSNSTQSESPSVLAQATGTEPSRQPATSNQSPSAQSASTQSSPTQSGQSQAPSQKPVGTAAAETVPSTGVAASQPAGTAIAPGKQRRTRSIVIKVGALVGAAVAVGTVAALSLGTSSKPAGAH
jgi:cobalamin biosynthesis Mg chelatase CobN